MEIVRFVFLTNWAVTNKCVPYTYQTHNNKNIDYVFYLRHKHQCYMLWKNCERSARHFSGGGGHMDDCDQIIISYYLMMLSKWINICVYVYCLLPSACDPPIPAMLPLWVGLGWTGSDKPVQETNAKLCNTQRIAPARRSTAAHRPYRHNLHTYIPTFMHAHIHRCLHTYLLSPCQPT